MAVYQKTDAGKAALARKDARYSARRPERKAAHAAVSNAVRDGRLTPEPCAVCCMVGTEAHHPDYSRKLDVVWLCRPHHDQLHHEHERMLKAQEIS